MSKKARKAVNAAMRARLKDAREKNIPLTPAQQLHELRKEFGRPPAKWGFLRMLGM